MLRRILILCLCMSFSGCNTDNQLRPGIPNRSLNTGNISTAIVVRGIRIVPPPWFKLNDHNALTAAIDQYLTDFRTSINWTPEIGTAARFSLTIFFHDVYGQNYYSSSIRTAHLQWPRGSAGKPLKSRFCPLFHNVMVIDRRRKLGISGSLSPTESSTITRGITLPITLRTANPTAFE